jgi:hypothetical protein
LNIVNLRSAPAAVPGGMRVHLVNQRHFVRNSGDHAAVAHVLAATPKPLVTRSSAMNVGRPTLNINAGDVVGIGVHRQRLRGYEVGGMAGSAAHG